MFHGVTENNTNWFSPRHIDVEHFEKLIAYLNQHFEVCDFESFSRPESATKRKKKILITFDDGYLNNLNLALPIMEKYRTPAIYFISTLSQRENCLNILWADLLTTIIHIKRGDAIKFDNISFSNGYSSDTGTSLFDYIKMLPARERDTKLLEFCEENNCMEMLTKVDSQIWSLMTRDQLFDFSQSKLVTIGSHGHMHYNLGNISANDALEDMIKSKQILEDITGKVIEHIAYPDGSYSDEVKNLAQKIGLKHQFAVNYTAESDYKDPRIYCRFGISSTTTLDANKFHIHNAFRTIGFE